MGRSYDVEHNAVLITCPYKPFGTKGNVQCEFREKIFDDVMALAGCCAVSKTDEPYIYEQSVEKILDQNDAEYCRNLERLYEKNPNFRGCACIGREGNKVKIEYELHNCMIFRRGCEKELCAVTGKKRDLELVNIYADVKYTAEIGTLFEHEVIHKGIKLTDHPIVKECAERMLKEMESWDDNDWLWRKGRTKPFRIYIKQGRIKDLVQDLMDARNGLEVIHDSDLKKAAAERKREEKLKKQKAKMKKLKEPQIRKCEYEQLTFLGEREKWEGSALSLVT